MFEAWKTNIRQIKIETNVYKFDRSILYMLFSEDKIGSLETLENNIKVKKK